MGVQHRSSPPAYQRKEPAVPSGLQARADRSQRRQQNIKDELPTVLSTLLPIIFINRLEKLSTATRVAITSTFLNTFRVKFYRRDFNIECTDFTEVMATVINKLR